MLVTTAVESGLLMGLGCDAADVPITMSFGKQLLLRFQVFTDEIDQATVEDPVSEKRPRGSVRLLVAGRESFFPQLPHAMTGSSGTVRFSRYLKRLASQVFTSCG